MSVSGNFDGRHEFGDRTLKDLASQIIDRDQHVGGGSAAAAAASLAASTAELVVRLSIRKSTPDSVVAILETRARRLTELREDLYRAGTADENALDALMHAYRDRKADRRPFLIRAASTVVAIATLASQITALAAGSMEHASRFTVTDLTAAAAIAHGAAEAAAATASVNFMMLDGLQITDPYLLDQISELRTDLDAAMQLSTVQNERARRHTMAVLNRDGTDQA